MKYKASIMNRLSLIAETVNDNHAKLAAAVVHKGIVVSHGINRYKTHPFQAKYGRNSESIYLHAEISAIHAALRIFNVEDLMDMDLYICRIKRLAPNKMFVHGLSKPCSGCMRAIVEFGFRNVYYTTDTNNIIERLGRN